MKDKDEKKPQDGADAAAGLKQGGQDPGAPSGGPDAGKEGEKKANPPATQDAGRDAGGETPADAAKADTADAQPAPGGTDANAAKDAGQAAEPDQKPNGEDADASAANISSDAEKESLVRELLAARSQLAAYGAGVAPDMIADAVTLATAEAQAAGDVTAGSIAKAMESVLKRHPDWKTGGGRSGKDGKNGKDGGSGRTGGFKLGVDTSESGKGPGKRRDLPKGTVIF